MTEVQSAADPKRSDADRPKIWAHSGDSHVMEPEDLWTTRLPKRLVDRAPRTVKSEKYEAIYIDGKETLRQHNDFIETFRPPGFLDVKIRLEDLDNEGVMHQLASPSVGFWTAMIDDPELARYVVRAWNEWALDEFMAGQDRIFTPFIVPMTNVEDAVTELEWAAERNFKAVCLPCTVPDDKLYGLDRWEPLWAAASAAGIVLSFHIGSGGDIVVYRGPGGAVVNYVETTYPGMRVLSHLVAGGALDRHPDLKMLIAEGGAGWVPALGDRMDEAYRQHGMMVQPKLDRLPSEIVRSQVYASFQHDISAVQIIEDTHYDNVLWGDDYPHLEGTYGHTQETLHGLFDSVAPRIAERVLRGTFEELFRLPPMSDGAHLLTTP